MQELIEQLGQNVMLTSGEEWLAFVTSLLYVWLASRAHISCWFFGIVSSALYIHLCFQAQIYAETLLQCFYVLVAVWGWINWGKDENNLPVSRWSLRKNAIATLLCIPCIALIGFVLDAYTNQVFPYIDATLFCFSIFATYLITKKILENWLYFILIDLAAAPLYWNRTYYLTALLYLAYAGIAAYGYFHWKKIIQRVKV